MLPPDPLLSYPSCFIASHLVMLHHVASYHIASPPPPSPPPPSPVQSPRLHYPIHLVSAHLTWLCYIMSSYHIPSHLSTAKHMCTCTVGRAKVRTQTSHCAFEHTHTHTYTHVYTQTHTYTHTHRHTHRHTRSFCLGRNGVRGHAAIEAPDGIIEAACNSAGQCNHM